MAQTQQAQATAEMIDKAATEVQDAELEQVEPGLVPTEQENLDILLDINMPITVNLGRTTIPFRDLLQTGPGSVLQLDKAVGQPAEIFVQDIRFATGDIVVVDGCFAVRIKEILGKEELEDQQRNEEQN
ncbi:MAG: FliM/FliN family flagellar motor switch protein [Sedimentisphaerales bacterium]|nr:FliM/FliN family flagellar motor switch protein [Sedimentisphaerales bacterium]